MKNPKNLTLRQKKVLASKGFEVNCYKSVKDLGYAWQLLNTETGMIVEVYYD